LRLASRAAPARSDVRSALERSALPKIGCARTEIGDQNNAHGTLWHAEPNAISNAVGYAKFYSRSHCAVIRVYKEAGNVIETHEHAGQFKEWEIRSATKSRHAVNRDG
jgi:hypothetical protein